MTIPMILSTRTSQNKTELNSRSNGKISILRKSTEINQIEKIKTKTDWFIAGLNSKNIPIIMATIPITTSVHNLNDESVLSLFLKNRKTFTTPYNIINTANSVPIVEKVSIGLVKAKKEAIKNMIARTSELQSKCFLSLR